jgi:Zn-dependent peptidase ImmA (M78 family)/DNA-binding XRE family transcriptional regulator
MATAPDAVLTSLAANLRRLREGAGLSQEALADRAGLSRVALGNIESRKSMPQASTLYSLADALGISAQELLRPAPVLTQVRFRSTRALKSREQVLVQVGRRLQDFNSLESLLGVPARQRLPKPASRSADRLERARQLAAQVRETMGLSPREPIRDICGLLEANGVKVLVVKVASDGFFGLSVSASDGGPAVVVNAWERISVERRIFTAAHELGHLLLHLDSYNVQEAHEEEDQEREANIFAAHFLMPDGVFWDEWEETSGEAFYERVLKVKRMFRVSYMTVLARLGERSRRPAGLLYAQFKAEHTRRTSQSLKRADEPHAIASGEIPSPAPEPLRAGEPDTLLPVDFLEDRLSRLVRQAVEKEHITVSRGAEILGLTVEQMRERMATWDL